MGMMLRRTNQLLLDVPIILGLVKIPPSLAFLFFSRSRLIITRGMSYLLPFLFLLVLLKALGYFILQKGAKWK